MEENFNLRSPLNYDLKGVHHSQRSLIDHGWFLWDPINPNCLDFCKGFFVISTSTIWSIRAVMLQCEMRYPLIFSAVVFYCGLSTPLIK